MPALICVLQRLLHSLKFCLNSLSLIPYFYGISCSSPSGSFVISATVRFLLMFNLRFCLDYVATLPAAPTLVEKRESFFSPSIKVFKPGSLSCFCFTAWLFLTAKELSLGLTAPPLLIDKKSQGSKEFFKSTSSFWASSVQGIARFFWNLKIGPAL